MRIILTNLLAFGTLFAGVFAITSQNPVISVICLIATFVYAAGYLILIGINFIGISYIVIYVGAIAVLFLFIIMMINLKLTDILETGNQYTKNLPLALAIGFVFLFVIFTIIPFNFNNIQAFSYLTYLIEHALNINQELSDFEIITNDGTEAYVTDLINSIIKNKHEISEIKKCVKDMFLPRMDKMLAPAKEAFYLLDFFKN